MAVEFPGRSEPGKEVSANPIDEQDVFFRAQGAFDAGSFAAGGELFR